MNFGLSIIYCSDIIRRVERPDNERPASHMTPSRPSIRYALRTPDHHRELHPVLASTLFVHRHRVVLFITCTSVVHQGAPHPYCGICSPTGIHDDLAAVPAVHLDSPQTAMDKKIHRSPDLRWTRSVRGPGQCSCAGIAAVLPRRVHLRASRGREGESTGQRRCDALELAEGTPSARRVPVVEEKRTRAGLREVDVGADAPRRKPPPQIPGIVFLLPSSRRSRRPFITLRREIH
ncbi:hypothetical protein FB451DRAFT_1216709 [Mycena latifolia]|nr:hypothetical protein FB451DRAFT_1216709 [Mycena latifolia]